MNIVVLLKQTFDSEAKIALTGDGQIDSAGVNLVMNPYDEIAVEAGLQLKEAHGGEVTILCVGPSSAQSAIRTALAMGADKSVLIDDPAIDLTDDLATAKILAKALEEIPYDIILVGRMAIDDGTVQLPLRLAEALNLPGVSTVLDLQVADGKATVVREIDGGSETVEVDLPAVIAAQQSLNEPRYPAMAGIMKAKKKPLEVKTLADLGLSADDVATSLEIEGYALPPEKEAGQMIQGEPAEQAAEVVRLLHTVDKVV